MKGKYTTDREGNKQSKHVSVKCTCSSVLILLKHTLAFWVPSIAFTLLKCKGIPQDQGYLVFCTMETQSSKISFQRYIFVMQVLEIFSNLFCACFYYSSPETQPGVLRSALGPPQHKKDMATLKVGPEEGHKYHQRLGAPLLQREAESWHCPAWSREGSRETSSWSFST